MKTGNPLESQLPKLSVKASAVPALYRTLQWKKKDGKYIISTLPELKSVAQYLDSLYS